MSARLDIWALAAAIVLPLLVLRTRGMLSRWKGAVFLMGYAAYLGWLAWHV